MKKTGAPDTPARGAVSAAPAGAAAAGKWRRALLTSAQLSTYYVGYSEVSDLARELLAGPGADPRAVHDRMLAHGSPPAGLLRTVL